MSLGITCYGAALPMIVDSQDLYQVASLLSDQPICLVVGILAFALSSL